MGQIPSPFGGGHHIGHRPIVDQAVVEQTQRLGDVPGGQIVVDGHLGLHDRPRSHPSMGADSHRNGPKLLLGAPILRLIAGERQRILRPRRGHAVDSVVQQPLALGPELDALGAEHHRVEQHYVVGQAVVNRGGGVHERHGAHAPGSRVVHHEAHIGEPGAVGHRLVVRQSPGDKPVDLRLLQPRIGDSRRNGLGSQRLPGPFGIGCAIQPGKVGTADADDGRLPGKLPITHRLGPYRLLVTRPPSSLYRRGRAKGDADEDESQQDVAIGRRTI